MCKTIVVEDTCVNCIDGIWHNKITTWRRGECQNFCDKHSLFHDGFDRELLTDSTGQERAATANFSGATCTHRFTYLLVDIHESHTNDKSFEAQKEHCEASILQPL